MKAGLKRYIERLESVGELRRVSVEVNTDCEISEITERVFRVGGEALMFENPKPQDSKFPVLTNIYGTDKRMAMALGVEKLDDVTERIADLIGKITKADKTLRNKIGLLPLAQQATRWLPRLKHGRGACQQYRLATDLSLLPILKCHEGDGGRFITLPMVCTVSPDTGERNIGMYRAQMLDEQTLAMHWHIHKTGARHFEAYKRLGKRMPVAVCLGGRPSYAFSAMSPLPDGIDEWLFAGFLDNRPVKLVKCLTNELRVPADCDIVIEGYVDPAEELALEGPFGDHTGFYSPADHYPKMHVTAITHCKNAVYPATVVGIPPQEDYCMAKAVEKIFLTPMRLALLPELDDLWMPSMGVQHNVAVININNRYIGNAEKAASSLWGAGQMMFNKYLLITSVQSDIRSPSLLAGLFRGTDLHKAVFQSEGTLDVLDHATDTPCYGGKIALNMTHSIPAPKFPLPDKIEPAGGVERWNEWLIPQWGTIIVRVDREQQLDLRQFINQNSLTDLKAIVIMDENSVGVSPDELFWLITANTDTRRDLSWEGDIAVLDARSRNGYPNIVGNSPKTIATVSIHWDEYGLGHKIPAKGVSTHLN